MSPPPISENSDHWHTIPPAQVFGLLRSREQGLSAAEVTERRAEGWNELPQPEKPPLLTQLVRQFVSPLVLTLVLASLVSLVIGDWVESVAIIVIVVLAGFLGFIQERQADKAVEALRRLAPPLASVLRDNREVTMTARELVRGDVLLLKAGDMVPADARVFESMSLRTSEAALTGESQAIDKTVPQQEDPHASPGDRTNMVFMGTTVLHGRGRAVVTGIGRHTEFGRIATMLQETEQVRTPLQYTLDRLGKWLGIFSIALAIVLSAFGLLRGYPVLEMFIWGVAVAVAVIPEALPAVVTITLALGVRRMARRRALVRKLPAVETLGATSVICSDKTGTLTQNTMTVRRMVGADWDIHVTGIGYSGDGTLETAGRLLEDLPPGVSLLLESAILCNDAELHAEGEQVRVVGDPTEGALLVAGVKGGMDWVRLRHLHPRIQEIAFTSERKLMTTLHRSAEGLRCFSKGAPEVLLQVCSYQLRAGQLSPLSAERVSGILETVAGMASEGLRVLGFATKVPEWGAEHLDTEERDMVFLGLIGMYDPPRPEVRTAIQVCTAAHIRPVMVTGDHKATAEAIAREIGILQPEDGQVLTGSELAVMSEETLDHRINDIRVFARIAPEHKLRIVEAFQRRGSIVAMTGDGINDAPALKKANIGVAMGISGTDVSKEAADMILTDDNFATIVAAVEEGRSIFQNIRKYLVFLLSGNMGTVFAMLAALSLGLPIPLLAVHILFINFVMDGLIAIALGVESPEPGSMSRPPRRVSDSVLDGWSLAYVGVLGGVIAGLTVGVYQGALEDGLSQSHATTLAFTVLILSRLFNGFSCRSLTSSSFAVLFSPRHKNLPLLAGAGITIVLTAAVLFLPVLHHPFRTMALQWKEILYLTGMSFLVVLVAELLKLLRRRFEPAGG